MQERKKQRRKNRAEREEEKRIKIQAATLRPTWADNLVREQMAKRKLAHEMRNEER